MNSITKYEFNKIMEFFRNKTVFEQNNIDFKIIKKESFTGEEIYRVLGDFEFDVTKNYISGKIPAEIALNLYNKYINEGIFDYSISTLIDSFLDDEFIEKRNNIVNSIIGEEEKMNLLINAYNELYEKDIENKYIEKFYIPTKEVLIDFIIGIINYNRRARNLNELTSEEKENLMLQIKTHIIEKSNPNILPFVWLEIIGYQNNKETLTDKKLKAKINELDKIINPFLSFNTILNNLKYFDDILEIKTDVSNINSNRFNNLEMNIRRKDTLELEKTLFKRDENEIIFSIKGNLNDNSIFYEHKYENNSETIKYELIGNDYFYIELNLNNNTIFKTTDKNYNKDKKEFYSITESELESLMVIIDDLIKYANSITLGNMNDDLYFIRKLSNKKR